MTTLWIIDDNPAFLYGLELAFQPDFQITTFSDPSDCLQAFREGKAERPDVLLVDNEMPGMTGMELIRAITEVPGAPSPPALSPRREREEKQRMKIILMSTEITFEMVIESWHMGVTEWLEKPFDLWELRGILEREIKKH